MDEDVDSADVDAVAAEPRRAPVRRRVHVRWPLIVGAIVAASLVAALLIDPYVPAGVATSADPTSPGTSVPDPTAAVAGDPGDTTPAVSASSEATVETDDTDVGDDGGGQDGQQDGLGTWTNVTPANMALVTSGECESFGAAYVDGDPARPSDLYAIADCQGIWKSTDYGVTWSGPINTGRDGELVTDCAGSITVGRGEGDGPPVIYNTCIRGAGLGFRRSADGGVNWTTFVVEPNPGGQDVLQVSIDPYDTNHIILPWHETNLLVESLDGGETWREIPIDPGMAMEGGSASLDFIDMGDPAATRTTFLYLPQYAEGTIGTWRTTTAGQDWQQVDRNEKTHGQEQIYQPDTSGVLYMPGENSALGQGVLRSTDYGETWEHVGHEGEASVVFGSPDRVYSMFSWACQLCEVSPGFQHAPQPGVDGWRDEETPATMKMGPSTVATVFNGEHHIFVGANWGYGLWRYVEP